MNAVGIALVWCAVQVTLVALLAGGLYLVVRKLQPAAGASVSLTGLLMVVALTAMALSPWPRWSFEGLGADTEPAPAESGHVPLGSGDAFEAAEVDGPSPQSSAVPEDVATADAPRWGTLLFQAVVDELSGAAPATSQTTRHWPAVIAVLFLVVVGIGTLWLVAGLLAVRAYRLRSRAIEDAGLLESAEIVRAELGCRRRIELRQSDALVTAATIGWRRPILLLPAEWRRWTDPQRRAVLAHEIAHVRAGHFLGVLCGQLGLLLHFYHPLVHWLMGRLRLEQELAADAAAAGALGGRQEYLSAIAELALRQPDRALVWPARTFLPTRTTFLRRIAMLREGKLRRDTVSPTTRVLLIGAVVLCGLLVAGLRGPASEGDARADQPGQLTAAEPAVSRQDSPNEAIDLTYVPRTAVLLLVIRPAAILSGPELEDVRGLLNELLGQIVDLRLPVEQIEQATVVVPRPLETEQGAPPVWEEPVTIVRATRAHDFEPFLRSLIRDAAKREYKGRSLQVGRLGREEAAYFLPDERTAVFGPVRGVSTVPGAQVRSRLPLIDEGNWEEFKGSHLLVAVSSSTVRAFLERHEFADETVVLDPLAPLWEDTTSVLIAAGLNEELRIDGRAWCNDGEAAEKVKETLEAVRVLARNLADRLRDRAEEPTGREPELAATAAAALDLVTGARLEREGKVVRAETSADWTSLRLRPFAAAIASAREGALRAQALNNLKQLGAAMHGYHDRYKRFPPAILYGPDGKTQHSWRVALLPFLDEGVLFERYRFDEPWDSPHNIELLEEMPDCYRHPKRPFDSTSSSYYVLAGPGTIFDDEDGTGMSEIKDGTSNTLLIVEADREVPWTKPEDIPFDPGKPLPKLGGFFEGGFHAVLADGAARFVPDVMDEQSLKWAVLKADGQRSVWPWFDESPRLAAVRQRLSSTTNRLRLIGLAMHNYYDQHKCFPPAVLHQSEGSPPYSWRVALLSNLGREEYELHKQYRFDEAWDGPNNRKLLEKIPEVYRSTNEPSGSTNASVFVLTGPGTVFDDGEGTSFREIHDGSSNTILAVEARRDIPWTKPEDIPYDPAKPLPELGGSDPSGFYAVLCDGSVRLIRRTVEEAVLRALIDKSDGQHIGGRY